MKRKTIILIFLFVLLVPLVYGGGYMEYASVGYVNNNFCKLYGVCTLGSITVDSIVTGNLSVIGQVFNVTMNLVTWNITESFNVGGDLEARNITALDKFIGNGSLLTSLTHSLDDAYDDGSVIQVDDDLLITTEYSCEGARCITPYSSGNKTIIFGVLSNTTGSADAETNFTINVQAGSSGAGTAISNFQILNDGELYFTITDAEANLIGSCVAPGVGSVSWYPLNNITDLGIEYVCGATGYTYYYFWRDIKMHGDMLGYDNITETKPGVKQKPIFNLTVKGNFWSKYGIVIEGNLTADWGHFTNITLEGGQQMVGKSTTGETTFSFNSETGLINTSGNITTEQDMVVDGRMYLSANSYMEADANDNIHVW